MVRQARTVIALAVAGALALSGMVTLNLASAATGRLDRQGTYSLWNDSATPKIIAHRDAQAVELGVRFTADQDGEIFGVRYYKSEANTGVHQGSLWTADGSRLARVQFENETKSGWQYAAFSRPVAIRANAVYVASYHTRVGGYSADSNYFSARHSGGPLSAPADGAYRPNGVYEYGEGGFPRRSYKATNYWVDVVFKPRASATPTPVPPSPTGAARPTPSVSVSVTAAPSQSASGSVTPSPGGSP
ncbi:DUF4082 domain-containing protein, partial [Micromonospora sp. NPDC005173]|uniref:DUF4082 domain-containing protein n=1 Tax=Micromonospora sp. NPDC005173 TaxID=3157165 RepID=UPI0033B439BA